MPRLGETHSKGFNNKPTLISSSRVESPVVVAIIIRVLADILKCVLPREVLD